MIDDVIDIKDVHRYYGDFHALKGISFKVKKGQIFGYLGPNGSGKTTTIKLILGLISPSTGNIKVLNIDPFPNNFKTLKLKLNLGSILEFNGLIEELTGLDNLVFWAGLYGINKKSALKKGLNLLSQVKLDDWADVKVSKYSYGMRKRLTLARSLISDPDILVLDEPTMGVDPESRYLIRNIIKDLAEKGKTVFFSSHDLEEVQKICSNIVIIKKGKIIFNGSLNKLVNHFGKSKTYLLLNSSKEAKKLSTELKNKGFEAIQDGSLITFYQEKKFSVSEFSEYHIVDNWNGELSLEKAYFQMVKEE